MPAIDAIPGIQGLTRSTPAIPNVWPWLRSWFVVYARRYLRRHFHAVRLAIDSPRPNAPDPCPTLIYLNHASWWDPLVCLLLWDRCFPETHPFAPIDASALGKYGFFRRLGFFPVEQDHRRGAASFLRQAEVILREPQATLWVTPQGRFADARVRPLAFKPGLGHLAARLSHHRASRRAAPPTLAVHVLPLAIEYTYWHERHPEILVRFGTPTIVSPHEDSGASPADWTQRFETSLADAMDRLAHDAQARNAERFTHLLSGSTGIGGFYDLWRRAKASVRGQTLDPRHGTL